MKAALSLAAILLPALTTGCFAPTRGYDAEAVADRLAGNLEILECEGFAGQLVVVHGDRVLVQRGFGTMSPGGERPVDAESVMPLASVTKPITASAVLLLASMNRLSLADPIGDHVPGLAAHWAETPVHRVLTHTAGLPGEIVNRDYAGVPRFEPVDRGGFIERVNRFQPEREDERGAGFAYSNVGYNLLAVLVESVSGQSFEAFVAEELLRPAGVHGVGLLRPGWPADRLVAGRTGGSSHGHYFDQPMLGDGAGYHLRGSGDLVATTGGVVDWWRAIRQGRWLPEQRLDEWMTPRVDESDGTRYGYGWQFRDGPRGPVIGHTGQALDFTVDLSWYTDADLLVYINSAHAQFPADSLRW